MPVRGDLGFPYLALVVLIFCSAIGLVVRRKWRLSVTRSEEIKRLLVLASEEAARAELEASIGYVTSPVATISRPLQYQCAVCFCPTTTRCARCKAVRYCSGKCQIIHWRQGHKEECRPFTTSYQNDDKGGASCQKVLKQEEYEINGNSFETVGRQSAKSVQNFSEKPASSKSDCSPEVLRLNDDSEVECLADVKGEKSSSHESERLDGHLSTNILSDKIKTNCVSNVERDVTDSDTHCASTSSSGWTVDGSNESSFSQPSSSSSDFWEGTIDSSRSKIDALHDSAQTSSSDAGDANMQNSQSSLSSSSNRNAVPHVDVRGSGTKTVISDDAHSTSRGIKGSMGRADLSVKTCEDASKGRNPDHMDVYCTSYSSVSGSREPVYCSSSAYASPTSSAGRPAISTHASKVGIMRSLSPERSNLVVNDKINTSHPLDSKGGGSLSSGASVAHPSTTIRSHSQGVNPGKVDNAHANVTTSEHENYSPNAKTGLKTSMQKVVDQLRVSKSSRHSQSGVGSEIAGRYNNKGLFAYELFVKLYNWNKIELRPCGLTNCGNSCYANAVLQCLTCTPPLTAYLLQGLHSRACKTKEWCFTCEFESLILKAKEGTSPLSPIGILSQIQNIGSHLGNGREEDAHEFLRYAVDTMHSVCLKEAGVYASGSVTEETTLIGLTFGGYLRSKIKCMKCGGKSERHERMMDLTVEIEGDIGTLEEALREFTGTEILDGENKYQCSRCRSYERAKKKMTVLEAPNILTIALKRFQSGKFGKLNKPIQFPEILDLAPYMSGTSDKSPIYRLYGVVVHLDVLNAAFSGHYVCYVKNVQNKWFKIDDSTVKAVDLESVLTKRAYLLLYARCSPRAPRLVRNSIISHDPRKPKNSMFKSRSHSTSPWDTSGAYPSSGHADIGCLYPNHSSFQPIRRILEDDSSSDHSSSIFSSEECSTSTDSSNRDSTSADDYFDHFFGDSLQNWNSWLKNSSDSDSSSSSSSPSPLFSRHSPLADSDRYSSGYPETSGFQSRNAESDMDNNGFWARQPSSRSGNWEGKVNAPILNCDTTKQSRKLVSSSSCRETDSGRLGWANSFDYNKSGLSLRRSTREQTD